MVGITSYGAYIPLYRLPLIKIAKAWNVPPRGKGERSVANYDEDSLSMSVGASVHALSGMDRSLIDGFYFAATTSPYAEKMVSTIGAAALDFSPETRTLDFTNSLRSGTGAMIAAIDALKAGSLNNVMIAAGDTRAAQTQGDMEQTFGDGAAAVVIGNTDVAAEIVDTISISDEIMDVWRPSSETYVRAWEERFGFTVSYSKLVPKAASMLLEKNCLAPQDLAKVVITATTIRRHKGMGKALGLDPEQYEDSILPNVGNTGTALPLMMLVQALETSPE